MGEVLSTVRKNLKDTANDKALKDTIRLLFEKAQEEINAHETDVLFKAKETKKFETRKQLMNFSDIHVKVQEG